jgi:hypothetical protein
MERSSHALAPPARPVQCQCRVGRAWLNVNLVEHVQMRSAADFDLVGRMLSSVNFVGHMPSSDDQVAPTQSSDDQGLPLVVLTGPNRRLGGAQGTAELIRAHNAAAWARFVINR